MSRRKIYTGEVDLPPEIAAALREAGMTVVPEAAPRSAAAEDLVILPAEYGITSELRHAVNNPLTAVLGYAELLERVEGLTPEVRARVEKILQYGRQVRDLVRRPGDIA